MANVDAAFGFEPVRPKGGVIQTNEYYVPSSDSTALFIGDPVILAGSADANGVATITRATAASAGRITGIVVGFRPSATIVANGYRLASTAEYVLVCDDPEQVYMAQDDADSATLAATDIGLNIDMIAGTGSAYTKRSGFELDTSTKATTATLQWRIVGIAQAPDNELGANAKVLVRINLPTETGAVGSTGV